MVQADDPENFDTARLGRGTTVEPAPDTGSAAVTPDPQAAGLVMGRCRYFKSDTTAINEHG